MSRTADISAAPRATKPNRRKVLLHMLLWAIFLSIPTAFNSARFGEGPSKYLYDLLEPPRLVNALFFLFVFYFNTQVAIPKFYFRRRRLPLLLSALGCTILFCFLNYGVAPPEVRALPTFTPLGNSFNLFMYIIVYTVSFVYCLYAQYHRIDRERLETRISFLTAQMNPHFLFNTLNSIYSLSLVQSDKVSDALVKLSGIMRYSIGEGSRRLVPLAGELDYIRDYIELQRLRLTGETSVDMQSEVRSADLSIAPFLLIPFVENAFKHGVNGQSPSLIRIRIEAEGNRLHFRIRNDKVPTRDRPGSTGLGIDATRQRLELLYPDRHALAVENGVEQFSVTLRIDLS